MTYTFDSRKGHEREEWEEHFSDRLAYVWVLVIAGVRSQELYAHKSKKERSREIISCWDGRGTNHFPYNMHIPKYASSASNKIV